MAPATMDRRLLSVDDVSESIVIARTTVWVVGHGRSGARVILGMNRVKAR